MKSISTSLKSLEAAGFLRVKPTKRGEKLVENIELIANGKIYCDQLRRQWLTARSDGFMLNNAEMAPGSQDISTRLTFALTQQFRQHLKELRVKHQAKCPTIARHQELITETPSNNQWLQFTKPVTRLVTDFFVFAERGLEHFYKIQRESKIWWMRYSSNPSRYYMEPFELNAEIEGATYTKHCQSVNIKSKLLDSAVTVEQLTMLPLHEATLEQIEDYQMPDLRTDANILPTIIRSTIELEPAACALLLDAYDHNRDRTLLLNHKLAPFQCGIQCLIDDTASKHLLEDLTDLRAHLAHVIQRAGLRLSNQDNSSFVGGEQQLQNQMNSIDSLGVPYTLIIDHVTTRNGLLRLRSRDTSLAETIHISDIPEYLLNIFTTT